MKKLFAIILAVSLVASFGTCFASAADGVSEVEGAIELKKEPIEIDTSVNFSGFGLQVDDEGVINLNGKPYYGMGVNFSPAFHLCIDKQFANDTHTDLELHFKRLSEEGIQVVRFNANVFYANQVYMWAQSEANKKLWLSGFDYLVALAEKYHIGLIPSLFWNVDTYIEYCGEGGSNSAYRSAVTDPNSKSNKLRQEYITAIVGRYKYSPAIYAWEIGNELNLSVDHPNGAILKTSDLTAYYTIVGNMIRAEDPYRMITGGDAAPRSNSMSLVETGNWGANNDYNDIVQTFKWYTPDPLDCQSLHYTQHEYIEDYVRAAKANKIGLYIGEWYGDSDTLLPNGTSSEVPNAALRETEWNREYNLYIENGIQVALGWTYGSYSQLKNKDWASLELGVRDNYYNNYYMATSIKAANTAYMNEGKNDSAAYWSDTAPVFYSQPKVYDVEISWGTLAFEYYGEIDGGWDPDALDYASGVIPAHWEPAVNGADKVTVTNNSLDAKVNVDFEYISASAYNGIVSGAFDVETKVLDEKGGAASSVTSTLQLNGAITSGRNVTIGKVSVVLSAVS